MPEYMADRIPRMSGRMPEYMPSRSPDRMPECMSDRLPEYMSERMPDRMSEYVRKIVRIYRIMSKYTS